MSWRIVVVKRNAKLSYKGNYLIIRNEEVQMIHLSEIHTLIIESTAVSITSFLLCELMNQKVKVIFCDEKRNPCCELVSYYGSHDTSRKIKNQTEWKEVNKGLIWTEIIRRKITHQKELLISQDKKPAADKLEKYIEQLEFFDPTNREGHAAKVYFNALFGKDFSRERSSPINDTLDYGYSILLSAFNREIVKNGYLTQLGLKHCNQFNYFNLSSDLMEPFRPLVDEFVVMNKATISSLSPELKLELIGILNQSIQIDSKSQYVTNAIQIYVKKALDCIETGTLNSFAKVEWR